LPTSNVPQELTETVVELLVVREHAHTRMVLTMRQGVHAVRESPSPSMRSARLSPSSPKRPGALRMSCSRSGRKAAEAVAVARGPGREECRGIRTDERGQRRRPAMGGVRQSPSLRGQPAALRRFSSSSTNQRRPTNVNEVVTPFAGTVNVASWRVWTRVCANTLTLRVTLSVRVCNIHS